MAAISGIITASYAGKVSPGSGGGNVLLYAVGAAVIGGTSLFGGKGKIRDAVIGGLVIATIDNGLGLLNQAAYINYIITGSVLLLAASVDAISRRRRSATGPRSCRSRATRDRHQPGGRTPAQPGHAPGPRAPSGAVSRAQLTERMGLNRSTIADLVRELEELAVVHPVAAGRQPAAPAGPRSTSTRRPTRSYVLAAELGVDTLDVARVGLGGRVLDRLSRTTPASTTRRRRRRRRGRDGRASCSARLAGPAWSASASRARRGHDARGLVRFAPNLGWSDVSSATSCSRAIGLEVPVRWATTPSWARSPSTSAAPAASRPGLPLLRRRRRWRRHRRGRAGRGASGYAGEVGHQPSTRRPALPLRQHRLLGDRDRLARRRRGGGPPAGR